MFDRAMSGVPTGFDIRAHQYTIERCYTRESYRKPVLAIAPCRTRALETARDFWRKELSSGFWQPILLFFFFFSGTIRNLGIVSGNIEIARSCIVRRNLVVRTVPRNIVSMIVIIDRWGHDTAQSFSVVFEEEPDRG